MQHQKILLISDWKLYVMQLFSQILLSSSTKVVAYSSGGSSWFRIRKIRFQPKASIFRNGSASSDIMSKLKQKPLQISSTSLFKMLIG